MRESEVQMNRGRRRRAAYEPVRVNAAGYLERGWVIANHKLVSFHAAFISSVLSLPAAELQAKVAAGTTLKSAVLQFMFAPWNKPIRPTKIIICVTVFTQIGDKFNKAAPRQEKASTFLRLMRLPRRPDITEDAAAKRPSREKAREAEIVAEPDGLSSLIKSVITGCITFWDIAMTHIVARRTLIGLEPSRRQTSPREFSRMGRWTSHFMRRWSASKDGFSVL